MRLSLAAALLGTAAAGSVGNFEVDTKDMAEWFTPPLLPLMKDAGTNNLFPMADCFGFKLEEATIDEMQKALEDGKLTSVQLVMCYILRAHQTQNYIK
jgi:amidase